MPRDDAELDTYLLQAAGIGRVALNVKCALGVFTLGWLLVVAFDQLGKKSHGWYYVLPVVALVVWLGQQGSYAALAAAVAIYAAGWVHANRVLSRIGRAAQRRVERLSREIDAAPAADALLKRGATLAKALQTSDAAAADFEAALRLGGGQRRWLNLAGVQACAAGRHALGLRLFERALEQPGDESLVAQITKNRETARQLAA